MIALQRTNAARWIALRALLAALILVLVGCETGDLLRTGDATATPTAGASAAQEREPTPTVAPPEELDLDSSAQDSGIEAAGRAYTGDVRATSEVGVLPKTSGQVVAVNVDVGDTVAAGDVLVELEQETLDAQVAQAEANVAAAEAGVRQATAAVAAAQANLDQATKGPKASEREAARKGLEAAQAALERLRNSPTEADLIPLEAQIRQAEAAVKQAQASYDQIKWREDAAAFPQALQLEQATVQYEAARAQYEDALDGPDESQIRQAEAQLAEAQATWEQVQEGTPAETIAAAEAQVQQAEAGLAAARAQLEQAQAGLDLARLQREHATVTAPISGQIARVGAEIGMLASSQQPQPLVTIVSDAVEVTFSVDETLVGDVAPGDAVEFVPDALPDRTVRGHVTRVSPVIDPQTRTVEVIAEPDEQDGTLRPGMSVTVALVE